MGLHLLVLEVGLDGEVVVQVEELVVAGMRVLQALFERNYSLAFDHVVVLAGQVDSFGEDEGPRDVLQLTVHLDV